MGSSPKPPKETTQVVKQENIPEWMQPYVTDVASRAQAVSREAYQPYEGQRVAGFTDPQIAAMTETAELGRSGQFGQAGDIYGSVAGSTGQFKPVDTGTTQVGTFGAEQASQYMSPYQQAVTDIAIRKAQDESARQQGLAQLGAAGRGSAGGSRQAIMDAMRQRGLTESIGDIQARGSQQAFSMAQQQFERDRRARIGAEQQDRQAMMMQAERDRQAQERDRQAQLRAAAGLTGLADVTQRSDLARLAAQRQAGAEQQMLQQQIYDQRYADFLRQRDYPKEQLGFYSNIVRGLPAGTESSEIAYARPPSFGQQAAGLGLGALSAYGLGGGFNKS